MCRSAKDEKATAWSEPPCAAMCCSSSRKRRPMATAGGGAHSSTTLRCWAMMRSSVGASLLTGTHSKRGIKCDVEGTTCDIEGTKCDTEGAECEHRGQHPHGPGVAFTKGNRNPGAQVSPFPVTTSQGSAHAPKHAQPGSAACFALTCVLRQRAGAPRGAPLTCSSRGAARGPA